MKRKEREHLKEDPFQIFFKKIVEVIKRYKNEIFIGLGVIGALIILLVVVLWFKAGSITQENQTYSKAIEIRADNTITLDQKIEKLSQLKSKKGISSSIVLTIAALHFEKGDLQKASDTLAAFNGSKFQLINDKKTMLDADILSASNKKKEAVDMLFKLYSDPKTEIAKDYLLLKMAQLQAKTGQINTAITNLEKLTEEFQQSPYSREANLLLSQLEIN